MNFDLLSSINTLKFDGLGNIIGDVEPQFNIANLPVTNPVETPAGTVRAPSRSALSQFISEVKTRGMARNNRYLVEIPLNEDGSRIASLFCESVALPGLNLATTQQRVYGEQREIPYERMFEPVSFTFYVDSGMVIKKAFDDWMGQIIDPLTRAQAYYNNYIREVKIKVFNVDDTSPYAIKLYEAYPKTVQAIQLDANGKDIMKLTVTMIYHYWQSEQITAQVEQDQTNFLNSNTWQDPFSILTGTGFEDFFSETDLFGNFTGFGRP